MTVTNPSGAATYDWQSAGVSTGQTDPALYTTQSSDQGNAITCVANGTLTSNAITLLPDPPATGGCSGGAGGPINFLLTGLPDNTHNYLVNCYDSTQGDAQTAPSTNSPQTLTPTALSLITSFNNVGSLIPWQSFDTITADAQELANNATEISSNVVVQPITVTS
jgi:hypothetical protein